MGYAIVWWATLEILGLIALPLAGVLLRGLPDRGYAASKIVGLLLVGWLAYTVAMLKVLPFGPLLLIICAAVIVIGSIWLLFRDGQALFNDLLAHYRNPSTLRYVITAELLFALAFFIWAWTRAYNPDIVAQEKFMDFGFMNAILKSGTFPPADMWLAGNSINYYYFGYVLMAALIALSGVPSEIAFALTISTLFALTALGAFGVVYNLIAGTLLRRYARVRAGRPAVAAPVPREVADPVAAAELLDESGTSPTLPVRRRRVATEDATALATVDAPETTEEVAAPPIHVEPDGRQDGADEIEIIAPPVGPTYEPADNLVGDLRRVPFYLSPLPYAILAALMVVVMGNLTVMFASRDPGEGADMEGNRFRPCFNCNTAQGFDWWAPSRVIQDYRTVGGQKTKVGYENISEFPAFSFVLGDVHAHVIGLPLVLLAITAGLAFTRRKILRSTQWRDGLPSGLLAWLALIISAIILGSLYTTNTWDYPTYLLVMVGALALPYLAAQRRSAEPLGFAWLKPWLVQAVMLVVLSLAVFLPFHLTFKSLVGGQEVQAPENIANIPVLGWLAQKIGALILVNTADKTILGFVVVFGIFLAILLVWLGYEFVSYLLTQVRREENGTMIIAGWAGTIAVIVLVALLIKFPLLGFLLPLALIAFYLIWKEPQRIERNMALLLFALAALLGIVIEVVFLRDNFQMRMNTIFKFYYQIWVLFALAAGYGLWRTLHAALAVRRTRQGEVVAPLGGRILAGVWAFAVLFLVLSGSLYAVYGVQSRQIAGQTAPRGLDGMAWMAAQQPGDVNAILWLKANARPGDVVLEAGSDEYNTPGRVSSYSGVPTLVAWDISHEDLWRTNQPELLALISERRKVVNAIYQGVDPDNGSTLSPDRLLELLHKYGVTYVFAGATERGVGSFGPQQPNQTMTDYAAGLFAQALPVLYRYGDTVLYGVAQTISGTGVAPPTPGAATVTPGGVDQPDTNTPPAKLFDRDGASANFGRFNLPRGIARDPSGKFYVVDTENERIEQFDKDGGFLAAFGGLGNGDGQFARMAPDATGTGPGGIAVDAAGNAYIADTWNHRLLKFDAKGQFVAVWGSFVNLGDAGYANDPDKDSRFFGPRGVAVGPDGSVYVTDTGNKRVLVFDSDGKFKWKIDSGMSPDKVGPAYPFDKPGELNEPIGIAVGSDGTVYVADTNNGRIQKFDNTGKPLLQWAMPAGAWQPGAYLEPFLALDSAGNVYATAPTAKTVYKFSPTGALLGQKNIGADGVPLQLPTGIVADADGTVYVVDTLASAVVNLGKIP